MDTIRRQISAKSRRKNSNAKTATKMPHSLHIVRTFIGKEEELVGFY